MNYYKELGVSKNASSEEIKKAYHEFAKKYHSDSILDENVQKKSEEIMKKINTIADVLLNPEKRNKYNQSPELFPEYYHSSFMDSADIELIPMYTNLKLANTDFNYTYFSSLASVTLVYDILDMCIRIEAPCALFREQSKRRNGEQIDLRIGKISYVIDTEELFALKIFRQNALLQEISNDEEKAEKILDIINANKKIKKAIINRYVKPQYYDSENTSLATSTIYRLNFDSEEDRQLILETLDEEGIYTEFNEDNFYQYMYSANASLENI